VKSYSKALNKKRIYWKKKKLKELQSFKDQTT